MTYIALKVCILSAHTFLGNQTRDLGVASILLFELQECSSLGFTAYALMNASVLLLCERVRYGLSCQCKAALLMSVAARQISSLMSCSVGSSVPEGL